MMERKPASAKSLAKRRRAARESFVNAASTIGPITPGLGLFCVTRGQFHLLDILLHCVAEIGRSHLSIWTWAVSDFEVEALEHLMLRDEILSACLIVDRAMDSRSPELVKRWFNRFGASSVKACYNHAKMCRVWNDNFRLLGRGSMNLNANPRFEQFDLSEGGPEFDLVARIESELPVLSRHYSDAEACAATQVGRAADLQGLPFFTGARTWRK
jgi:hypothetical protein